MFQWFTRNEQGFWCDFCGEILKPSFHFDSDEDWDEFENELEKGGCDTCGAPDEFDHEMI
jgi:hypothetical protein